MNTFQMLYAMFMSGGTEVRIAMILFFAAFLAFIVFVLYVILSIKDDGGSDAWP